jgi:pimeloyl-ACP methyl ester carboxylesterase
MPAMFTLAAGSGAPPLVFVHGFTCDHTDWAAQIAAFAPRHAVLACDLRGHGETPGDPADCSIETLGADVAALLAGRGLPPAVLVGHSMGCRVVLEAYRAAPERVAAIALIDGSRMGTGDPEQAAEAVRAAIDFVGFESFAEALATQMFLRPSAVATRIVGRAKRLPGAMGAALFPAMLRWDAAKMETVLGAVRVPLLIVQSTTINADKKRVALQAGETTPWLELARRLVPHVRIEVIAGVGHFPQIEVPDRVNALLADFVGALG